MSRLIWVLVATMALSMACSSGEKSPEEPPRHQEKTATLEVAKRGTVLGTLVIRPGERGDLALASDSEDAKSLEALWKELSSKDETSVKMHVPTKDGERGGLSSRVFRVGMADYPDGARWKLVDRGYQVTMVEPAEK